MATSKSMGQMTFWWFYEPSNCGAETLRNVNYFHLANINIFGEIIWEIKADGGSSILKKNVKSADHLAAVVGSAEKLKESVGCRVRVVAIG